MRQSEKLLELAGQKTSRRAFVAGGIQLAALAAIGLRMHRIQVIESGDYRLLSENNRINFRVTAPERGRIFDRTGRILADNQLRYHIAMLREAIGRSEADVRNVLARLKRLLSLDQAHLEKAIKASGETPFIPVTVADRLSWEAFSRVAANTPALPGILPRVGTSRHYFGGNSLAHVVGYVGPVSERDLARFEEPPPVLRIPHFRVGKVGVEARMEGHLRGAAGVQRVEVNATGRVMREVDRRPAQPGSDLQLSIDLQLQSYVQARLGEDSASAIVLDCLDGNVLAIASSPTYDPNAFVRGMRTADFAALREHTRRPLASKAVQDAYPPGSTFKLITCLAALEAGIITPEDSFECSGRFELSNRTFHCWKARGHGEVAIQAALRDSCDVFHYNLALKTGIDRIAAMARKLGLGSVSGIEMSAESAGLTPDRNWKQRRFGQNWLSGDTVNAGIGQGYVLATPLQLAVMTARLATGRSVSPRLIHAIDGQKTPGGAGAPLGISADSLRHVRAAMAAASNDRRGTAYASRVIAAGYRLAGKTGTSQVRNISRSERESGVTSNEDLPWEQRDHALFVCFAPVERPKISVAVIVEHGGSGAAAAAPIARDITLQALYDGYPPLTAYPVKDRDTIRAHQAQLRQIQQNNTARASTDGRA